MSKSLWGVVGTGALAVLVVLGMQGCGCSHQGQDKNTIRFRYWGDTDEVKIIEGLVHDFEAANPGVKVKPERKNSDSTYADVLLTEFASDSAPDVIFVSTDNIDILADSNKLADLNPWLAKDPDLKADQYYDAMIKRFSKNGKLMVLPRDIAPISCVYYNKDLFDKAGLAYPKDDWTWDDLRTDAMRLTKRGADGTLKQAGFADDWNLVDTWILSGGGKHLDDYFNPTKFTFAEGGALDGILFRYKLLQVDKAMPSSSDSQSLNGGSMALFLNNQLGMFHSGLWKTPGFRKIQNFKWDVAPFPRKKGTDPMYWAGGSGYTMKADAANPELCWKLIKFMAGPDGQKRIASTGLAQPALKALANSPVFLDGQDPQNKKMLLYCAEHAQASPAWKPWVEFVDTMWRPMTDPMWIQGYTGDPDALLKDLQDKANAKFFPAK
jgi:ABC-type glycerol-3-phosphate transport system substrate-binding protein